MSKLVITRWNKRLLTALFSAGEAVELGLEEEDSILGNIYIGKVKNIVRSLNSAFVDFGEGRTGYYSLTDNPAALFADGHEGKLKAGDEILVQVAKDAVKTKDPVLTANLNFSGKYAVLTAGKNVIGFSAKIEDKAWKEMLRPKLKTLTNEAAGIIVRTNAYGQDEALLFEVAALMEEYRRVMDTARYRTCFSLLYEAKPQYLKSLLSCPAGTLEEIVTDQEDVYRSLDSYIRIHEPESGIGLRFYEDPMISLTNLYALKTVMDEACRKHVWLKSGGYLVIECTEAMVVIDVNTGKYSGKRNQEDTVRMINLEAAKEVARQLRLRNLSGIIIVDFIDMDAAEDRALLMETLKSAVKADPVKTTVVDMTPLGLVELTRKKGKKPLREQLIT